MHHIKLDIVRLEKILNGSKPIGLTPDLDRKLHNVLKCLGTCGWRNRLSDSGLVAQTHVISIHVFAIGINQVVFSGRVLLL